MIIQIFEHSYNSLKLMKGNTQSCQLYQSAGFMTTGSIPNRFGNYINYAHVISCAAVSNMIFILYNAC